VGGRLASAAGQPRLFTLTTEQQQNVPSAPVQVMHVSEQNAVPREKDEECISSIVLSGLSSVPFLIRMYFMITEQISMASGTAQL